MRKFTGMLLALLLALSLTACGGENKTMDIAAVKESIIQDLGVEGPLDLATDRLTDLYDIDTADIKNSASFITMGGSFPDEIVIIEAADANAASRVEEKLEARLAEVMNQSQNYDAENYALLEKCKVQKTGNYVALFISAQNTEMQKIFENAAK